MILGTWNLEVYASPRSRNGQAQVDALLEQNADLWFLTELHAEFALPGQAITFSRRRPEAPELKRKGAISTRWPMEPIAALDDPVEGRLSMARVYPTGAGESLLAVCSVLPWRGATPHWRQLLGRDLTYAEVYAHLLDYVIRRIADERRPGESVILGGDFNQGLTGRDYVGTLQGRSALLRAFEEMDLQVPTRNLPAQSDGHPAIDHIAFPATWRLASPPRMHVPERDGRTLSDHALYLVQTHGQATW